MKWLITIYEIPWQLVKIPKQTRRSPFLPSRKKMSQILNTLSQFGKSVNIESNHLLENNNVSILWSCWKIVKQKVQFNEEKKMDRRGNFF